MVKLPVGVDINNLIDDLRIFSWEASDILLTYSDVIQNSEKELEILKNDNLKPSLIRAGNDNLFQSEIFSDTISTLLDKEIQIHDVSGAYGAARAVGCDQNDFNHQSPKRQKSCKSELE